MAKVKSQVQIKIGDIPNGRLMALAAQLLLWMAGGALARQPPIALSPGGITPLR
jgi:hypothetical protein